MSSNAPTVGVRELRQNLSKYLTRVKAGESLVVTERGEEVARLVPSGAEVGVYSVLAERLEATIPTARFSDVALELAAADRRQHPAGTADEILADGRRERF